MKRKHGLICGRMQPLHQGHFLLIKRALNECDIVTLALGSAQEQRTVKNFFSASERMKMVWNLFSEEM